MEDGRVAGWGSSPERSTTRRGWRRGSGRRSDRARAAAAAAAVAVVAVEGVVTAGCRRWRRGWACRWWWARTAAGRRGWWWTRWRRRSCCWIFGSNQQACESGTTFTTCSPRAVVEEVERRASLQGQAGQGREAEPVKRGTRGGEGVAGRPLSRAGQVRRATRRVGRARAEADVGMGRCALRPSLLPDADSE